MPAPPVAMPQIPPAVLADGPANGDVTGSIPAAAAAPPAASKIAWSQIPPTERLPDAIGGPALRAAALKGDADRGL